MLRFLVVGTLRCGLAYTAQVFNRMGIACGHGWVHTPDGARRYPDLEILGDAAPLAAPASRGFDGLVLHQVRHPLEVIGSLIGSTTARGLLSAGPEGAFLARHVAMTGDPLDDAMRHYVEWNLLCERHNGYVRYRVEDLDARLLVKFSGLIGRAMDVTAASTALEVVPSDFDARYGGRSLNWSDLPGGVSRDALTSLAARYGYPTADERPRVTPMRRAIPAGTP